MSLHQISAFLRYKLTAVGRHSLQGPFISDFYERVIRGNKDHDSFDDIEYFRKQLLLNHNHIAINDFGAGSRVSSLGKRKVSDLAKSGLSSRKFSAMLFRLSVFLGAADVVELGTSFGINTLYLAKSNPRARVTTFEGCPESAKIADGIFAESSFSNIDLIHGNIDVTLSDFVKRAGKVDLVYFDANHRFGSTLRYYEQLLPLSHDRSVFVIDDIYWSKSMAKAWKALAMRPEVTMSIDIFDAGLLFFNPDLHKEHLVLEF